MGSPETTISTRRFCCRPAALSLDATGSGLAEADGRHRGAGTPCPPDTRARNRRASRRASGCTRRCRCCRCGLPTGSSARDRQQNAGHLGQFFARAGLQRVLVEVEEHVGDVDDQAARRFARFQNQVQLLAQALAQSLSFSASALSAAPVGRAGAVGFGLRGLLLLPAAAAARHRRRPFPARLRGGPVGLGASLLRLRGRSASACGAALGRRACSAGCARLLGGAAPAPGPAPRAAAAAARSFASCSSLHLAEA